MGDSGSACDDFEVRLPIESSLASIGELFRSFQHSFSTEPKFFKKLVAQKRTFVNLCAPFDPKLGFDGQHDCGPITDLSPGEE